MQSKYSTTEFCIHLSSVFNNFLGGGEKETCMKCMQASLKCYLSSSMIKIYCVPGASPPHLSFSQLSSLFLINPLIFLRFTFTTTPTGFESVFRLECLYFLTNKPLGKIQGPPFHGVLLHHGNFSKPGFLHWSQRQRCSSLRVKPCYGGWSIPKREDGMMVVPLSSPFPERVIHG